MCPNQLPRRFAALPKNLLEFGHLLHLLFNVIDITPDTQGSLEASIISFASSWLISSPSSNLG